MPSSPPRSTLAARRLRAYGVRAGDRVGILLPMLIETVVVGPRGRAARGDLHADLLGLRGAGDRRAARRLRGNGPHHGRRVPPPRRLGPTEGRRGRGGRGCALGPSSARRPAGGLGDRGPVDGRSRCLVGRARAWRGRRRKRIGRTKRPTRIPETPYMIIYTSGHDRPAEGRGPRPRRFPDQGRPGPRPPVRPRSRRQRCSGSPTSAG